jgi:hypothetical protein
MDGLYERIARTLGWTVEQTHQFSWQMLREILRAKSPKLAYLLESEMKSNGGYTLPKKKKSERA